MVQSLGIRWHRNKDAKQASKLRSVVLEELHSWLGTKYSVGQCCKGVAADCTRFVFGVIDNLYRYRRFPVQEVPGDIIYHNKERVLVALNKIMAAYRHDFDYYSDPKNVETGDLLIIEKDGIPFHSMIVGVPKEPLWECAGGGVSFTGIPLEYDKKIRLYRAKNKERWLR